MKKENHLGEEFHCVLRIKVCGTASNRGCLVELEDVSHKG